jgi:predicted TIM-barrel fold metal-dependent hydrolase
LTLTHIGEDNMIMGSDYGHQGQSKEDGMVGVMQRKKSISPAVIEKILCDNPRRFYGL